MTDGIDERKRRTLRRFAAVGAAAPFVGTASAADDTNETREAIRGYVPTTPGAHFSKLRDDLQLGTGETQHHLRRLLNDETLVSRRDGDYRRFFVAGRFSTFEQTALGYLRRETPRGMLLTLLRHPDATGTAVADALDVSRATVSTYATQLDEAGLLDRTDGYAVARPETVITLLVRYADSFGAETRAFADEAAEFVSYDP